MSDLSSNKLFGRSLNLVLGVPGDPTPEVQANFNDTTGTGFDVSGFHVEFVIEKSLKPENPNTCALRVYNLAPSTRQSLSGVKKLVVKLEAGYRGATSQLYFAETRAAWTTKHMADYITHVESTDTIARPTGVRKSKKLQPNDLEGSIYRTMGARVPLSDAIRALAKALGVGTGNAEQLLTSQDFMAGLPIKAVNGSALVGNGARRMTDICRSAGLEWSIQDGNLQFINIGHFLDTTRAILLNDSTGLIDSPSVDSQGSLSLTTLLIPGLNPGVRILLDSEFVKGYYRIEKIRYAGSTRGQEWYAHIEAARYT